MSRWASAGLTVCTAIGMVLAGCNREPLEESGPIPQNGYLWQREWTPAVVDSLAEAEKRMDGIVVLGAEIVWENNKAEVVEATIDWATLTSRSKPISVALRVSPYAGPFAVDSAPAQLIASTAKRLLEKAHGSGVRLASFQIDFDCAQKKLAGYRTWLTLVRLTVRPVPLVVTTLPAWLDEPEFARLIGDVDGYVLQVHSVPLAAQTGNARLCDTSQARRWVAKATRLGVPFAVSLPTYRCAAGYDENGKLLSVAMDGVDRSWPRGTRVVEFATDSGELAALVSEWKAKRPAGLRELFWYRLPVATDERNWRWPTLSAVMDGRTPLHKLEVLSRGENPVDLSIANIGEADEQRDAAVAVTWTDGATVIASDSLPGWSVAVEKTRAIFKAEEGLRLSPGATRSIGWLRYDRAPNFRAQLEEPGLPLR